MTRGWWRRNAVPLTAIAVLLPVTVGVVAVNEWSAWDQAHPSRPVTVEPGASASYGGALIGPATSSFTVDEEAPAGTRVVRANVLITPGDDPLSCGSPHLREAGGQGRQWNEASLELSSEIGDDRRTSCASDLPIRYSLTLSYLVPDDASGPFVIELESADEFPRFVRLVVEP